MSYTCEGSEVVTITDKYVFNGKYPDGFEWYGLYLMSDDVFPEFKDGKRE